MSFKMIRLLSYFVVFIVGSGFLLDNSPSQNQTIIDTNQLLTLEDKIQLHREIEELRGDQTKTLNILTAQLKQKLDEFDRTIASVTNQNITCEKVLLENIKLTNGMRALENAFNILENKTHYVETELSATKNRTIELENELREIKQLKNVQDLKSLTVIKSKMETIDTKVNSLASHEQARREDFLAFYNSTKHSLSEIHNRDQILNASLQSTSRQQNNSLQAIESLLTVSISDGLAALERSVTDNVTSLRQQIQTLDAKAMNEISTVKMASEYMNRTIHNKQIVALTARAESKTYKLDDKINFNYFITSIGLTTQTSLRFNGTFICEYPGMYLFSVLIESTTDDSSFNVLKTDQLLITMWIGHLQTSESKHDYHEVTGVFVLRLQKGDRLNVKCRQETVVTSSSTVTIVKLD